LGFRSAAGNRPSPVIPEGSMAETVVSSFRRQLGAEYRSTLAALEAAYHWSVRAVHEHYKSRLALCDELEVGESPDRLPGDGEPPGLLVDDEVPVYAPGTASGGHQEAPRAVRTVAASSPSSDVPEGPQGPPRGALQPAVGDPAGELWSFVVGLFGRTPFTVDNVHSVIAQNATQPPSRKAVSETLKRWAAEGLLVRDLIDTGVGDSGRVIYFQLASLPGTIRENLGIKRGRASKS
jgi:hypothetical protein